MEKIIKATGNVYYDKLAKQYCLILRPSFLWWFTKGKILISEDDLNHEVDKVDYY